MSDPGDSPWAPRDAGADSHHGAEPTGVDPAWAPPGTEAPASPPLPTEPDRSPSGPFEEVLPTVSTGPVEAVRRPRPRVVGRVVGTVLAVALLGGGGLLALAAGSARAGAGSPEGALRGALDALSAEDLVGAAEFVEPAERALLVEAGFDVVEELVRLEVLAADLDLAAVEGIDVEIGDVELGTAVVGPGVAHVYIDAGRWVAALDVDALPLGPLVRERAPAAWLESSDQLIESVEDLDRPVVAVERDGRWYLSLWYTLAENLRLDAGLPFPDPDARPTAVGADSPEGAVEELVTAAVRLDAHTALALFDPVEGSVLYDYAPVILDDVASSLRAFGDARQQEGWIWDVTSLDLSSEIDGATGTVTVDRLTFVATSNDVRLEVAVDGDVMAIEVVEGEFRVELVTDGECITTVQEDGGDRFEDRSCLGDPGAAPLFDGLTAGLQAVPRAGIVTHRTDGRWYVSPTRTATTALLDLLASIEPDALAGVIDSMIGIDARRGFADNATSPFGEIVDIPSADAVIPPPATAPPLRRSTDNADLVVGDRSIWTARDLVGEEIMNELRFWSEESVDLGWQRGFQASVVSREISISAPNEIVVVVIEAAGTEPLGPIEDIIPGELHAGEVPYVRGTSAFGSPMLAARFDAGIVVVGTYEGWTDELVDVLTEQVLGR